MSLHDDSGPVTSGPDPALIADPTAALAERPCDAALHNARGVLALASSPQRREDLVAAANAFQDAWSADPRHIVAGLNLAHALVALGQREPAAHQARRVLAVLDGSGSGIRRNSAGVARNSGEFRYHRGAVLLDDALAPYGCDLLRVEWERAGPQPAGDPASEARTKVVVLQWRLHTLLGELTGDLAHFYSACLLRPDLPATRAALGLALARHGRLAEAVPHLEEALHGATRTTW